MLHPEALAHKTKQHGNRSMCTELRNTASGRCTTHTGIKKKRNRLCLCTDHNSTTTDSSLGLNNTQRNLQLRYCGGLAWRVELTKECKVQFNGKLPIVIENEAG